MRNHLKIVLVAMALIASACSGNDTLHDNTVDTRSASSELTSDFKPSSRVHVMPWRAPAKANQPIQTATIGHLSYYGGRVIQHVYVIVVFWTPKVDPIIINGIPVFFGSITNSPYFDWLAEYNTTNPAQAIGRGSFGGAYTITPSITSNSLTDAQIQTELNNQINAGVLPSPTSNTVYMTYFPAGISITQGGSGSCVPGGFCAYHGTFNGTQGEVYYGVMPNMAPGSGCNTGCGADPTWFNNATSVSSHELLEAVTDAEVGLATVVGSPLAWYDSTNGEIGDICNAQQGTVVGADGTTYVVQKAWSNAQNACVTSGVAPPPPPGPLQNGGFESGNTGWTASTGVINTGSQAHSGTGFAWLDGYGTTHTDTLVQSFVVPSTASTLTYWLKITTAETTTTTQYDKLTVQLKDSSGAVLATQNYSNLNKSTTYVQKSFNIAAYRGMTIALSYTGTEDSSLQTSFYLDDVSVQ